MCIKIAPKLLGAIVVCRKKHRFFDKLKRYNPKGLYLFYRLQTDHGIYFVVGAYAS